jgi:HD-GYP domain-containing protein (c-di-GMP phosphodiesterase class II)
MNTREADRELTPAAAAALLNGIFGADVAIYTLQNGWAPIFNPCSNLALQPVEFLESVPLNQPSVHPLPEGGWLVAVPITWFDAPCVGVAFDGKTGGDVLLRLAHAAGQLLEQHHQLSLQPELLRELLAHGEENVWLRQIASLVTACEANHSFEEVSKSILPRLQEMVAARSVGFVPAAGCNLEQVWIGPDRSLEVSKLISQHAAVAQVQPLVLNARSVAQSQELGVNSIVLLWVGLHAHSYGWLVAVDHAQGKESYTAIEEVSENEFGTVEAGLLQAVAALLATHARNIQLFRAQERLTLAVIRSIVKAIDARDRYTQGHSDRVARYAREIARALGKDRQFCEQIYLTGLLHDVGKIGIPDAILKKNGKLTDEEFEVIKRHPVIGCEILDGLDPLSYVLPGVRHHHERPDGGGYPSKLTGDEIPEDARILGVADAYDAMTSSRSYRKCMAFETAEQIIRDNIGNQFDEASAEAFFRALPAIHEIAIADTARRVQDSGDSVAVDEQPIPLALIAEIDTALASFQEA